ncbi:MAG TPA: hypothetical protein VIC33_13290 [Vicinamibacterales bacterium]
MARRRGRPSKFGKPARLVALTLPHTVVSGLQGIDPDLGWAIVRLFEKRAGAERPTTRTKDVELLLVGRRQALISVNPAVFTSLPGVSVIPIDANRALLALEPNSTLADLEVAVIDRLEHQRLQPRERQALMLLRRELRHWRQSSRFRFHTRTILVAEPLPQARPAARA